MENGYTVEEMQASYRVGYERAQHNALRAAAATCEAIIAAYPPASLKRDGATACVRAIVAMIGKPLPLPEIP